MFRNRCSNFRFDGTLGTTEDVVVVKFKISDTILDTKFITKDAPTVVFQ